MATGTTLGILRVMVRQTLGLATSAAVSPDRVDPINTAIRFAIEQIGDEFGWPHVNMRHPIVMQVGERYYGIPVTIAYDGISRAWVDWQGIPHRLEVGIGDEQYAIYDIGEQRDPPQRYRVVNDGTAGSMGVVLEFWPTPATALTVYLEGPRVFKLPVLDADICPFDDQAVVYWAASNLAKDPEDQKKYLALAQKRITTKRSKSGQGARTIILGEGCDAETTRPSRVIVVAA